MMRQFKGAKKKSEEKWKRRKNMGKEETILGSKGGKRRKMEKENMGRKL